MSLGFARFETGQPKLNESHIYSYRDTSQVEMKAVIDSYPEAGEKTIHLSLKVNQIKQGAEWRQITGNVLAFVPKYSDYRYGDTLVLKGELKSPIEFEDFDYREYLANRDIYVTMLYPDTEILDRGHGFKPLSWIYALRQKLSEVYRSTLPEPQASLTEGIVLGIRGDIQSSIKEEFARSGTTHLLAISGANLSIVAGMLTAFAAFLFGRRHNVHVIIAIGIIWLYAILTGFAPPVVRSAIMASLFLTAELVGRQKSALPALTFSAAVMTAFSPNIIKDAAFQLSFLSTCGLVILFPQVQKYLQKGIVLVPRQEGFLRAILSAIADSLAMSFSALIFILPLLAHYFGLISPTSLPATALALPALPLIIMSGALTGVSGLALKPLAELAGFITSLFISYLLAIVKLFADMPFSSFQVNSLNGYVLSVYYLVLVMAIWLLSRRKAGSGSIESREPLSLSRYLSGLNRKWLISFILVAFALATFFSIPGLGSSLHVSFIDVGQGDSILVRQGATQILVDGGSSAQSVLLELGRRMPLWDRNIELVVLTHPDSDHLTGLLEVMKRYKVSQIFYPEWDYTSEMGREWLKLLKESDIKNQIARSWQQIEIGDTIIEVINPTGSKAINEDDGSVVLRVSRGKVSFLLTGDISSERELDLIFERANLKSTVLKVSHHGSGASSSREFLAVVSPDVAVISVGKDNEYGHPKQEVLERLKEKVKPEHIYRTDLQGTIEFTTDGKRLWVRKER